MAESEAGVAYIRSDPTLHEGIPGYRVLNFDVSCSNDPDRLCPGKVDMVKTAMGGITEEDVDSGNGDKVRDMVCAKLLGYNSLSTFIACDPNGCAVRDFARNSTAVKTMVKGVDVAAKSGLMSFLARRKYTSGQ